MADEWFGTSGGEIAFVVVSSVAVLAGAIAVIRLAGLRALSKMSSFDFVVTIALGSIVATVAATSSSLWHGLLAFFTLLVVQWVIARLRLRGFSRVVDNEAMLLVRGTEILHDNLRRARVTDDDLRAKLREANVIRLEEVLAVVLETTGDISVLHGDGQLDERLLDGVRS